MGRDMVELILLESIKKLGDVGELVKVSNGYARNFLLPKRKAIRATEESKARFKEMQLEISKGNDEKLKTALAITEGLQGKIFNLVRQAAEDGKLYGSVSPRDIANLLKESNSYIEREHIVLEEPIKYLGEYKINISLYSQAEAEIIVRVTRHEKAE